MKKVIFGFVLAIGMVASCGGSACSDLQDECDACEAGKALCQAVVDGDDADACDAAMDVYKEGSVACGGTAAAE